MKKLASFLSLALVAFAMSSCCSMFGLHTNVAAHRTETRQVRTCHSDTVIEEVWVEGGKGSKGGYFEQVEKKVPRMKTVEKKVAIPCGTCTRFYCPKKDCCGSTAEEILKMSQTQGPIGSPHMGLVISMKPLAP